ncbi:hypothetical protein Dsin_005330 [Dipteronia sinensis]|uniref:Uncharacterized protein n=1 Tax=Dipteronia sinensis TaxID=43782 RepID=A0AAE0AX28_9ROSI|nr:hypothetical protein Dsin_005330 [Dipteronia sinensis]
MDDTRKSQKKPASSSPNEDSKEILEKLRHMDERIAKLEEQGNVLAHDVSRSSRSKLQSVNLGYSVGHSV